ncbi:MAG: glycosyltransferase family 4 protein [Chitinophagales bacterium]|nr:glycosyltransferase family 4 protein [Chitinophagaceae bacterium]MCB9065067.1 glycosyltransferase family 4 protein [Chitinophagales bacterium]
MSQNKKILVTSFQSLTEQSAGGMARLGYYVSEQLHKRGILDKFVVFSKGKHTTSFPSVPVSMMSRVYLRILNSLNKYIKLPDHKFRLIQEHLYDILCKRHIKNDISILFTTNAHMRRTFAKAKKKGIRIIYVPANPEEDFIYNLITEENKKLNIEETDAYTYYPRLQFYHRSIGYVDTVVGTYPTVYKTYIESGSSHYDVVELTGHLKPDFKPYTLEENIIKPTFKVIFVASTVVLKGLQYLLEAWEMLMNEYPDVNMELHIVGFIEVPLHEYIKKRFPALPKVTFAGRVPDVTAYLKDKDLSVVPSLTDGGPYVALEAAHYGLPVILTENCGSAELLSRNQSGCKIIPIKDAHAIKEQIVWAYNNREEAKQLGLNAKHNLESYDMGAFISELADYLKKELENT